MEGGILGRNQATRFPGCSRAPRELWGYQQEVSTLCHPLLNGHPGIQTYLRARVNIVRFGVLLSHHGLCAFFDY